MAQARYDAVADFYISGFDSADDRVSLALLDLLEPVTGLRVLDVACGHGRITRELARRGADVVGIDISRNLISKARETEQNEPLGIHYINADVTTPRALGDSQFDAVACSFGLSDIDDLDAAITAVSGALRPHRHFVFSILHPVLRWGKGHRRLLANDRHLLRRRTLDGPRRPVHAASPGRSQPPDALDLPQHAPPSQPAA